MFLTMESAICANLARADGEEFASARELQGIPERTRSAKVAGGDSLL
jgi:hypothetical protein